MKNTKNQWREYNQAQASELQRFPELLRDLVQSIPEPERKLGRPCLSLREQAFCAIQKVYSQLSSRRAVGFYEYSKNNGLIKHAPHFNAASKFLNQSEATELLQELLALSATPLQAIETDFAVDATGFRTRCFGEYAEQKYDLKREHKWVKVNACVGTKTHVITAVEFLGQHGHESPSLPDLIERTADNGFEIQEVSADKAYSSRKNLEAITDLGAKPFIPFKVNANPLARGSGVWRKMYYFFALHKDEFYASYHKRSNSESAFHAIKRKFGDTLKSKNELAQRNELLCKIIAYNICVLIMESKVLAPKTCGLHLNTCT